jgi:hypothetical protein
MIDDDCETGLSFTYERIIADAAQMMRFFQPIHLCDKKNWNLLAIVFTVLEQM